MSIVSRIKEFLSEKGIQNCEFADKCDIPRPTISQLLNGRNKKVSDDILTKIHIAYPEVSMMWLMFGEGGMCLDNGQNQTNCLESLNDENLIFENESECSADYENEENNGNSIVNVLQNFVGARCGNSDNLGKSIVNVMVLYSDNSFDTFKPSKI